MPTKQLKVGVYIPTESQLLDMAAVDILHIMSHEYLSLLPVIPKHVVDIAPSVSISYITSPSNMSAGKIPLSAFVSITPTHDVHHPDVQPGKLDVVIVPGPDPNTKFREEEDVAWLRAQAREEGTDVLSICTGIYLCGAAGLLDGKKVCGPRGLQGELRGLFPRAEFVGGGITNGNDLIAAYAREGGFFPPALVEIGCKMAEVGERPQLYEQGNARFTIGFAWQIIRAWFSGPGENGGAKRD